MALVPLYVDGDADMRSLSDILRANGFALRCDVEGRTVAEPISPGLFNLVRNDAGPRS